MMEEKDNVLAEKLTTVFVEEQGAEAQGESGSKTTEQFGKFQSADALLQAYNSLQAEFTRRSQRLKELEKIVVQNNPQTTSSCVKSTPMPEDNGFATTDVPASAQNADAGVTLENEDALFLQANASQAVKQRIIEEYLAGVKKSAVPLMGAGVSVTVPATRAKNIADAGQMALGYFKTTH